MDRTQIKALLESKGFDVNVRLEGDQMNYKVTLKSSFRVPVEGISSDTVLTRTRHHIRGFLMSMCSIWYTNLGAG